MNSLVLARKWRPKTFDEVAGQSHVLQALKYALDSQRLHHAYLFTGTRGVGKTSIARLFAKAVNCEKGVSSTPCGQCHFCTETEAGRFIDFIEIDAASRSKVEDTRDILDNTAYAPSKGRYKIYLIDEVHMLSAHSFNALLKTLEEPPSHVIFLLATTDSKKLPITILSRCLQFHLKNMLPEAIKNHLAHILELEKISFDTQALESVAEAAGGSLRDALSLLDQAIAHGQGSLQEKSIREMLGYIEEEHILAIAEALANHDGQKLLSICDELKQQGADCQYILQTLQYLFHQLTIRQCVPDYPLSRMAESFTGTITLPDLQLFYQIALKGHHDLALTPTPWIGLEMTLLRMLAFQPVNPQQETVPSTPSSTANNTVSAVSLKEKTPQDKPANQSTPVIFENTQSWENWLPRLKLTGIAETVAQHCLLTSYNGSSITLSIEASYESLLTPLIRQRIEKAVSEHLNQPIHLNIELSTDKLNSPAAQQQQKTQQASEKALQSLERDTKFQKILNEFNGMIVPGSVKLLSEPEN